jgi:hypothetical protein
LYGFTVPIGATWLPAFNKKNPQIILNSGLMSFFGFSTNYNGYTLINTNENILTSTPYVILPTSVNLSDNATFLSNISPIVNPINSYLITCNLISSKFTIPSNILYSIPLNSSIGQMISIQNSNIIYNAIRPGTYEGIIIELLDQNYNKLVLKDTEILLILSVIEE